MTELVTRAREFLQTDSWRDMHGAFGGEDDGSEYSDAKAITATSTMPRINASSHQCDAITLSELVHSLYKHSIHTRDRFAERR